MPTTLSAPQRPKLTTSRRNNYKNTQIIYQKNTPFTYVAFQYTYAYLITHEFT